MKLPAHGGEGTCPKGARLSATCTLWSDWRERGATHRRGSLPFICDQRKVSGGAKNFNLIVNPPLALSRISQRARNSGGTTVPTEFRRVIATKLQMEKEVEFTENRHVAVFCALPPEPYLDP